MPSFKANVLLSAVKDAKINPKAARDEELFYVCKLAIWLMHKSLLVHMPKTITAEIIQSEAEAIWEISGHMHRLSKKKHLKEILTDNKMKTINILFNEAISLAGTVINIYNTQAEVGSRILFIYRLCDQLKEIFDSMEGEDIECASIDPTNVLECSLESLIKINYKQKGVIEEKINALRSEKNDVTKFCFCKNSIDKWHKKVIKTPPFSIDKAKIELFEEAITELKIVMEAISYGEAIGNKLDIEKINSILNTGASQIGEVATIYRSDAPTTIQRRLRLLADFKDQLGELHKRLKMSKIDCSKILT